LSEPSDRTKEKCSPDLHALCNIPREERVSGFFRRHDGTNVELPPVFPVLAMIWCVGGDGIIARKDLKSPPASRR